MNFITVKIPDLAVIDNYTQTYAGLASLVRMWGKFSQITHLKLQHLLKLL